MPIFKAKQGPILSRGRLLHFLESAVLVAIGGAIWHYEGVAWVTLAVIVLGFGWELSNRWTKGWHQFADYLDFVAFVIGAVASGLGWIFLS